MKIRQTLLLLFFVMAGAIVGGMLATICAGVPFLNWLAFSAPIGFNSGNPFVLDLSVLQLTFGFSMNISVGQIITISIALFSYSKLKIR